MRSTPWIEQHEPEFAAYLAQIPPTSAAPPAERILDFLAGLRSRYGSVPEFLTGPACPSGSSTSSRARPGGGLTTWLPPAGAGRR